MSKIMDNEFPTSWNRSQNFALHGTTLIVAYYPSYSPGQAQVGHFHVQRWAASIPSDPTMSPSRGVQMPKSNNTRVALSVPLHHNYVQRGPMSPALPVQNKLVQSIVASGFLMLTLTQRKLDFQNEHNKQHDCLQQATSLECTLRQTWSWWNCIYVPLEKWVIHFYD